MVTSHYWNMVHGSTPEQVMQDLEGVQIMRVLGKKHGLAAPLYFIQCAERHFTARTGNSAFVPTLFDNRSGVACLPVRRGV